MSAKQIVRDALFGNPPSPTTKPSREGVLAGFGALSDAIELAVAALIADNALIVYAVKSSLDGNLAPGDRTLGIIYNDGANNGIYIKSGAAGSGSWTKTGLMGAGPAGDDATIAIGTVTSGAAPAVTNTGTSSAAILNFVLQRGVDGKSFLQTAIDTGYVPAGTTEAQLNDKIIGQITAAAVAARDVANTARDQAQVAASSAAADRALTTALKAAIDQALAGTDKLGVIIPDANARFQSIGAAMLANIPAEVKAIDTLGFYQPGDGGGAGYRRTSANPGYGSGCFRSTDRFLPDGTTSAANGGWWQYVIAGVVLAEQFGARGDFNGSAAGVATATDNYQPFMDAMAFGANAVNRFGPDVLIGKGRFYCAQTLEPRVCAQLRGTYGIFSGAVIGAAVTLIYAPKDVCNIRINSNGTRGPTESGVAGLFSAAGSFIKDIVWAQVTMGTSDDAHGIHARAQVFIERCSYVNTAGHGQFIQAFTDGGGPYGEASNWTSTDCFAHTVRRSGHRAEGADVNTGRCIGFRTAQCGECGIDDAAYFTNTYEQSHIAGYGLRDGIVFHNGALWQLIRRNQGGNFTPGAPGSERIWYRIRTQSQPIPVRGEQWVAGKNYRVGCVIYSDGSPCIISTYIEGGGTYGYAHAANATIVGTNMGWTHYSNGLLAQTNAAGIGMYRSTGGDPTHPAFPAIGEGEWAFIGSEDINYYPNEYGRRRLLYHYRARNQDYLVRWNGEDIDCGWVNAKQYWIQTGPSTTRTFGRSTPQPYFQVFRDLVLQNPFDGGDSRVFGMRGSKPTTTDHGRGEHVLSVAFNLQTGMPSGWVFAQNPSTGANDWLPTGIVGLKQAASIAALPANADLPAVVSKINDIIAALKASALVAQ